jgi:CobN/Magnesium Chelatase
MTMRERRIKLSEIPSPSFIPFLSLTPYLFLSLSLLSSSPHFILSLLIPLSFFIPPFLLPHTPFLLPFPQVSHTPLPSELGPYPGTVAVTLWGLDTIKTKGESVAILLALVGAEPVREVQQYVQYQQWCRYVTFIVCKIVYYVACTSLSTYSVG